MAAKTAAGPTPAYADPIAPQVDVNDYLRTQTMRVGTDTITWASGSATAPSRARSRFVLPKVGLLSRLYIDIDAVSATGYDLTIGAGAAAAAADGRGPFQIVDGVTVKVNGGSGWYDVSGFGTYIVNAVEAADAYPDTGTPGTAYATAPTAIATTLKNYPVAADGRPRFGLEVPFCLGPSNPLGMLLLQNDLTTVELEIRWGSLDAYAALTGGAVATLTLTATVIAEVFDIPPADAFGAFFRPMLRWGHWWREERQDVTASGRGANIVSLDNHDTYLRVFHTLMRNSVLNTDNIDDVRFVLNRNHTLFDHDDATHFRRQRKNVGKDVPVVLHDFFATGTLRAVIHADAYTDIRSEIDLSSVAGTNWLLTATEKLVDLGEPGAGAAVA